MSATTRLKPNGRQKTWGGSLSEKFTVIRLTVENVYKSGQTRPDPRLAANVASSALSFKTMT